MSRPMTTPAPTSAPLDPALIKSAPQRDESGVGHGIDQRTGRGGRVAGGAAQSRVVPC